MSEIISGTTITVSSGVVSSGLHVIEDGEITVLSGGTVTDAEASQYGWFWVEEGGYISNILVTTSGEAFVNGSADNLTMESGGQADILAGTMRSGTILDQGVGMIFEGASGLDVKVSSGGRYLVYGGYAENTAVSSGGSFLVQHSGGLASRTTILTGGSARVVSAGEMRETTLNGGNLQVLSGAVSLTQIQSGGSLFVDAAGEAFETTLNDGGILNVQYGTLYDTVVLAGSAELANAAVFRFSQLGGTVDVKSGTVLTEGTLNMLNGGVMTVRSGAMLVDNTFLNGQLSLQAGAAVSRGELRMELQTVSGALYKEMNVVSGMLDVGAGADVAGTTVSESGRMTVRDGAVVTGTTVNAKGTVTLLAGGSADGIAVIGTSQAGQQAFVISGVTMYQNLDWEAPQLSPEGGVLLVSSGAIATNVLLQCGTVCVYDGAVLSGPSMTSGGALHIESGGIVRDAVLNGTAYHIFITGGGIPSQPSLGYVYVSAGGLLENAEATWLQISVSGGGVIRGLTVSNTSIITVDNGGTLTGRLSFVYGATVNMAGGILDFDISAYDPVSAAAVNDLQCIKGAPVYTVTLSDTQAAGRYRLADNAHGFGSTITVRGADWQPLGTLTINALTEIGGRYYQTKVKNESLYLTIWDEMPAVLDDPLITYVNPGWGSLAYGTVVEIPGGTATVGYDAFATGNAAAYAVETGGKVVVTGGNLNPVAPVEYDMEVLWGATVAGATVSGFGTMTLRDGAEAKDLTVSSAGLAVDQGAKLSGNCRLSGDITVNGTFEFDISGFTAGNDTALMRLYSDVKGTPDIVIVVNDDQAEGVYTLASAPVFYGYQLNKFYQYARSITVVNQSGVVLGSTSPGITGSSELGVRVGNYLYTIQQRGVYLNGPDVVLSIARAVTGQDIVYVDASWQSKSAGDQVYVHDPVTGAARNGTIGVDAFGTIEDASAAVDEEGTIYISAGTFSPADGIRNNVVLGWGVVENTTLYGSFDVSGGTARNIHAAAGSVITVETNGTLSSTGGTVFDAGAEITVDGTLEFDLRGLTPETCAPLYDGLAYVKDTPDCSIRVMSDQAFGVYCLGVNAAGFNGSFTVTVSTPTSNTPIVIGIPSDDFLLTSNNPVSVSTAAEVIAIPAAEVIAIPVAGSTADPDAPIGLSVGGTYRNNGVAYSLSMQDGALYLTISGYEPPQEIYVRSDWADRKGGDVVTLSDGRTAVFGENAFADYLSGCEAGDENSTVYLDGGTWSLNEKGWREYKKTVAMNGTVLTDTIPNLVKRIYLTLEQGAAARDFENNGVMTVKSGAILSGEVKTAYGTMTLQDGVILDGALTMRKSYGEISGTIILENVSVLGGTGSIVVEDGGTITGSAVFNENMDITLNGTLEFDISGSTAGGTALFDGLSYLKGKASYSLTVSASQENGVYRLGDGVTGFSGSISVRNTAGKEIGSLEAGKSVRIGGSYYTLRGLPSETGYLLYLVIGELPPPETVYINAAWSTKEYGEIVEPIAGITACCMYDAFADADEALRAVIPGGNVCILGGSFSFTDGVTIPGTVFVNGGTLGLTADGGRPTGAVIVSNNGRLDLERGGALSASVMADATSIIGGSYAFAEGMNITVNGTLLVDISGSTAGGTAAFEGLSHIQGTPSLSVVLEGKQSEGAYLIASDAARIGTVSVRIGNEQYTLAVNSGTSIYYNQEITVEAVMDAAGNLMLQVEGYVRPSTVYINSSWDWNTPKNTVMTLMDGGTAVYGYDAFREGKDGFDVLAPGGTLVVEKGKLEDRNFYDAQSVVFLGEGELGTARINSGATITAKAGSTLKCTSTKLYFNSGSTLTVEAGAVLTGTAYFDEGSVITVDGTLEFDISRINGNSKTVLFTNLSLVGGNTAYRLKTVGWESEGEYILASGAADFDGTISVVKNDVEIGTLTVGGRFFSDGKYYYLTRKDNGNLVFSQSDRPVISQAYVNPGWATLEDGTVVQINGATATIGYDAFADVDTALNVLPENATLNVTGGTVTSFGGGVKKNVAVWDGACLTNVTINSATLTLESGASARNIIIGYTDYNPFTGDISSYKSGELLAKSGAAMQDITFLAGSMTLKGNASIRNLYAGVTTDTFATPTVSTITSTTDVVLSGTITLRRDVTFRGGATFADDAVITVDGTLAFDISGMAAGDGAQYRGLSMVYGTPNFTLTVGGSQGLGKYALADGVSEFNSTITVTNATGASLGTLRLNSVLHIGDVNYRLTLSDGVLSVDVFKPTEALARSDVDGNGVSDVLFQYTGGDNQTGYWMNGKDAWRSTNMPHPAEWTLLGAYDMDCDGIADSVFVGNGVELNGKKGAYIGYYKGGIDTDDNWVNIDFLENEENNTWLNKIGNLTGNVGANSIVWHCAGLGALGVWTDGTSEWVSLGAGFDSNWTMIGCGDFNGDGRDSVVMSYLGGVKYYAIGLDGSAVDMGSLNWGGWEVRAIGDFAGDGRDDMVLFHKEFGAVVMLADGKLDSYTSIGQLDAQDWFIVGAGDYDGDRKDDLLVRQYSTGMLGYYSAGDTSQWTELGRGVDMDWTVIA